MTGVLATAVLASRASFTAARRLDAERAEGLKLDWRASVWLVWKDYIPAVTVGSFTVLAIVGSNRVSTNRAAALAAAYSISEQTFDSYKRKVIAKLGEDGEHEVRAAVAQEKVNATGNPTVIIGTGKVLCFDEFSGRYFESTVEDIKKAQNDTNYQLLHEDSASLSDFYARVGLPPTSMSDEVGWNSDKQLEVLITSCVSTDQRPAISVSFQVHPSRNYWKFG